MGEYIGLDVSLKQTSMCVVDESGSLLFEGKTTSDPKCLAKLIRTKAPNMVRVGLESGQTSVRLTHALRAEGLVRPQRQGRVRLTGIQTNHGKAGARSTL